ncbi:MAG: FecR domain-containing protein [Planctomycetota bacterium]
MTAQELDTLIHGFIDDRLNEAELQALNHVLRHSPAARRLFWQVASLEGYLVDLASWRKGQEQATDLAMPEALRLFLEMEEHAEAELQILEQPLDPIHLGGPGVFERAAAFREKMRPAYPRMLKGLAAAACVGLVLFIASEWKSSPPADPESGDLSTTQVAPAPSPVDPVPEAVWVATLERVFDLDDQFLGSRFAPGAQLEMGERLVLDQPGFVELMMASGVRVVLQGPGTFTLADHNRIEMSQGRATASVPPQATGFTVQTPVMDFIDHGTEFGVLVDEQGRGEILVFDGLVEARQPAAKLEAGQRPMSLMIREGWGGEIAPDQVLPRSLRTVEQFESLLYPRDWDGVTYLPRVEGQVRLLHEAPPSLVDGAYRTLDPVLIPERRGVTLTQPLAVRIAGKRASELLQAVPANPDAPTTPTHQIPEGVEVNAFLIHFDKDPSLGFTPIERTYTITFPGEVLGILQTVTDLNGSDLDFGSSQTRYTEPPVTETMRGSRDPFGSVTHDAFSLSDDGRTLAVTQRVSGMDQVRIIVRNTDQ